MRNITVMPYINRVTISIGKYYSQSFKYDIDLVENNDFYQVYKIIGDTSDIDNKELVYMLLKGYDGENEKDIFEESGIVIKNSYKNYSSRRSSSNGIKHTHLFPPIELLTADEYTRNPYRFKNFRLEYNNIWEIVVDGNLVGKGYVLFQSNDYFECLNSIRNLAGIEFDAATRFYLINDVGNYEYFDDINKCIDMYKKYISQKKDCLLGSIMKLEDYTYYANQEIDIPLIKPTDDFLDHIYFRKVENQAYFRANPKLIDGINSVVQRVSPGKMLDLDYSLGKIAAFSKSYIMTIADKEKKVR